MTTLFKIKSPKSLALLVAILIPACPAFAQATSTSNDVPPVTTTEPTTSATNIFPQPPSTLTNHPSILVPPKQTFIPGGSSVRSAFSGKFVVPGRTLRLPAPEADNDTRPANDWNRSLTFAMNMTQGNSDTLRYALGLDAAREKEQNTTRVRARAGYGESEGQKVTEYATALYRYDRKINRRFYALGNLDALTDTIADIDYRLIGILSPGFNLWRNDQSICKMELGAGYLAEQKGSGNDSFAAGRAAASLEHILNAHVLTWASVEYVPKLQDPKVFYVNSEVGLAAMLTRDLNLNLTLEDRYDNTPALDKESNDLTFTTSMSLKF
jgi:hypothetical protein